MVSNKHVSKIIIALMAVAVVLCILAVVFSGKLLEQAGGKGVKVEYETKLFDTDQIISIDILMDDDTWNDMLSNAMTELYYSCDVVVNGTKFHNVAIRPKGNTSLSAIAMDPDTDRFSLKLEFGHFVEGQTCFGLDKLILNNNYADATNMKEAIVYDMYQYIGADASLYNYASVSRNGEYQGVYLALEAVEQSFMLHNYGAADGELYKPESMGMGGGDNKSSKGDSKQNGFGGGMPGGFGGGPQGGGFPGGDFSKGDFSKSDASEDNDSKKDSSKGDFSKNDFSKGGNSEDNSDKKDSSDKGGFGFGGKTDMGDFDFSNMPDMGDFNPENMQGDSEDSQKGGGDNSRPSGGKGGFSMGSGGANLNYTDDDLDSYSTIWEGEITTTGNKDHRQVVKALKNISEGNNLEKYLDVDNVLKYMAVHTFAVNMDSLSGSMAHNYYLYEDEGQLNIIPWDYNLAFGGMSMGNSGGASGMINDAIDTPFSGTEFFDALLEDDEYRAKYHEYLKQLVDEYVNGGRFDETYNRIRNQIDSLVEEDPTAFYDYEEYQNAADMFYKVIKLRAQSIEGQLNGTIPSTDDGQKADSSTLVDASDIDVTVMGQFSMGGFDGDFKKKSEKRPERRKDSSSEGDDTESGDFPANFDPANMPDFGDFNPFESGSMPGGGNTFGTKVKTLASYGIYMTLAVVALVLVIVIKRRR